MNKKRIFMIKYGDGYYVFKLEHLLASINKTKYSLSKELDIEYKVINRYAHGDLTRFDAGVIAKICDYCNCSLDDIIEYVPNEEIIENLEFAKDES